MACPFEKGKRLMFKENNHRLRFLSEEEITRIIEACSPHLKPIVEVPTHTGAGRATFLKMGADQQRADLPDGNQERAGPTNSHQ